MGIKNYKKAVVGSFFTVFILCSVSTALQLVQGSTVVNNVDASNSIKTFREEINKMACKETNNDDTADQLRGIFEFMMENFDENDYKAVMKALDSLQRKYLGDESSGSDFSFDLESFIAYLESQDEETQEKVKSMVEETYLAIQPSNLNGRNTDEFYTFLIVYWLSRTILQFGLDLEDWRHSIVPATFIICGIIILLVLWFASKDAMELSAALITSLIASMVPFLYMWIVFYLGWWQSVKSVDMTFYVTNNSTGVPLNGLNIRAVPWDNILPEWNFYANQPTLPFTDGLYFIPSRHVANIDVPPGKFDFTITGIGSDGQDYNYAFNNSDNPIPCNGKYARTIPLDPIPE